MRTIAAAAMAATLCGCAAVREVAALRQVEFRYDRLSDPEIVGLPLTKLTSYDQLSMVDVGRLALAIAAKDVPLDVTVHVVGRNPETNRTAARLVRLDWVYLVDGNEIVAGSLAQETVFAPGVDQDVPLDVRFNLVDFFGSDGKVLFDTALVLAGQRTSTKRITLRIAPTVETSVGPIRYPVPLTLELSGR
jgi:hypothetical protein